MKSIEEQIKMRDWNYRQLAAEFIATLLFVWGGTGAAVSSNRWTEGSTISDPAALLGIAIAFGFSISVLAYGIGHISGGHINPAVTLSFVVMGKQSIVSGLLYVLSQCIGGVFGSLILWGCTSSLTADCDVDEQARMSGVCSASLNENGSYGPAFSLGLNVVGPRTSAGAAFLLELVGTYLLVLTVLNAAVHTKSAAGNGAPIAIGWAVVICHIVLIPYTGCGINPARSLGPMIVDSIGGSASKVWVRGWWVFYTAPFVGSLLATATYKFIFEETDDEALAKKDDDHKDVEADAAVAEGAVEVEA